MASELFESDDGIEATPRLGNEAVSPTCPGCGYDLSGTLEEPAQRCPECGRAWTVEELALQHVARSPQSDSSSRVFAAVVPGLTVGALLLIGLMFGPPVTWLTFPVAALVIVLAGIEWSRDLYRHSFKRARTRLGRLVYVAGLTTLLIVTNIVIVLLGCMLLLALVTSCGWLGRG